MSIGYPVGSCANHGPAPIPEEGKWVKAKRIEDISGLTHGVGWCAPQQGACKLTLNVKAGIIQEALVEVIGCSGMTQSAAMAGEILPGKTIMEALNTDLVCDAINVAMRELFLQIAYGRSQTAFSEGGLPVGSGYEELGHHLRSVIGTIYGSVQTGPRYFEIAEGYVTQIRAGRRKPDHRLSIRQPRQDAGQDPRGRRAEQGLRGVGRYIRAVRRGGEGDRPAGGIEFGTTDPYADKPRTN